MAAANPYLSQLAIRLAEGLTHLPEVERHRHARYLRGSQNADGGFSGREGGSDLYYTGFALRGLAVLNAMDREVCSRAALYLRQSLQQQASIVDLFSLLYASMLVELAGNRVLSDQASNWPDRLATALETFRSADGGYAKTAGGGSGSVYHTFLVGLCYQLLGGGYPAPEQVLQFVQSRHRDDGGFVEIAPMRRSGTNPTAAAIGILQILEAADAPMGLSIHDGVVRFLMEMQSEEGGFRGNGRAPVADLLSTFTGLWTLDRLKALNLLSLHRVACYVRALEIPEGGFRGGLWDGGVDVEYTFYGLGCLALLSR
jgi:geranylgeranyl transferase type-2 subunit beta